MYAGRIAEQGTASEVLESSAHPYTRALLSSIPSLEQSSVRLQTIAGMVPSLANLPSGCRFHPRCKEAREQCAEHTPELTSLSLTHQAACLALNGYRTNG